MRYTRKVEHEGQWWAQRADGSWVRWNALANAWEPQASEPPGPQRPPPENVPADAMNPVDRWWNRNFPPQSTRRMLFLLATFPAMTAILALVTSILGQDVSLAAYAFVAITGEVVLAFLWLSGALKPDREPAPTPSAERTERRGPEPIKDFLVGFPIAFVGITMFWTIIEGRDDALGPAGLGINALIALLVTVMIVLRNSVWSVILFSLVVGLGGAIFLQLFSFAMGFEESLIRSWLLASAVVFVFAFPHWLALKRGRRPLLSRLPIPRPTQTRELPMWILMTGTVILMIGAAIFFRVGE